MWIKQKLLEVALKEISRTAAVLSNAYTGGVVKFLKKLSLGYCANGSSLHDIIADNLASPIDAETGVCNGGGADLTWAIDDVEREEMARSVLISLVMLPAREARIVRLQGMADFPTK